MSVAFSPLTNLLLRGRVARFAAIDASVVAAAAAACLQRTEPGVFRYENAAIRIAAAADNGRLLLGERIG